MLVRLGSSCIPICIYSSPPSPSPDSRWSVFLTRHSIAACLSSSTSELELGWAGLGSSRDSSLLVVSSLPSASCTGPTRPALTFNNPQTPRHVPSLERHHHHSNGHPTYPCARVRLDFLVVDLAVGHKPERIEDLVPSVVISPSVPHMPSQPPSLLHALRHVCQR
jgi:hypothetical protein